jgi:hypothetical protein
MTGTAHEIALIVVPDPADPECAEVTVDGSISGRPYRFLLDTGAARTQVVSDDLLADLPSNGRYCSAGIFASGGGALVSVSDFELGALREPSLEVVRVEAAGRGLNNLLGMDVLRRRCCHFRFDSNTLLLGASPAAVARQPLPMDARGHFYVDVSWPRVRAHACWDSGAGITLVDRAFLRKHRELFEEAGSSVGTDSTGIQAEAPTFWIAGPAIGGAKFRRFKVAAADLARLSDDHDRPIDLILGYTALRQSNWLFDFPTQRWRLSRSPGRS